MPVQWGTNPAVSQSVFLLRGTHAARPAAAPANQDYYYLETDTGGGTLFQSSGSAWVQAAGPVTDTDITTFAGLTDVDMTGVTDGEVPAFNLAAGKYEPAVLPAASTVGYVYVSQNTGIVVPDSSNTVLPIETVNNITSEFTAAPADTVVTINQPGVYLAIMDVYPTAGTWTTGFIKALIQSSESIYRNALDTEGAAAADSGAMCFALLVVATVGSVEMQTWQTSGGNQTISGDLLIVRLGLPTS